MALRELGLSTIGRTIGFQAALRNRTDEVLGGLAGYDGIPSKTKISLENIKHGLSLGVTSSSDLKSPFFKTNLVQTATKIA